MSKKRTQYSSEFKTKVVLAAIYGDEIILQMAARYVQQIALFGTAIYLS